MAHSPHFLTNPKNTGTVYESQFSTVNHGQPSNHCTPSRGWTRCPSRLWRACSPPQHGRANLHTPRSVSFSLTRLMGLQMRNVALTCYEVDGPMEPSVTQSRPRLGCLAGTLSPPPRQIRSTRLWFTLHPSHCSMAVTRRYPYRPYRLASRTTAIVSHCCSVPLC